MRLRIESGQSLFEVVVAIAVSAIIVVALVSLAANSIKNSTFARNKTIAARYAEEATEWLRGERDNNTDIFFANTTSSGSWCFPDLIWPSGPSAICDEKVAGTLFTREIVFTSGTVGVGQKLITADVIVSWGDAQGIHEVRSSTSFTDWREQ